MHYDELKHRLNQAEAATRDGATTRDALRTAWSDRTGQHDLDAPQSYDTPETLARKQDRLLDRILALFGATRDDQRD